MNSLINLKNMYFFFFFIPYSDFCYMKFFQNDHNLIPDVSRLSEFRMAWQIPHGLAPLVPWCRAIKDRVLNGDENIEACKKTW